MIAIGCDHGGFELKQEILAYLREKGIEYKDFGCDSTASVDYPVYAKKVCKDVYKRQFQAIGRSCESRYLGGWGNSF